MLEKTSDTEWILHLHPAQKYLTDPQRGRQFRHMANRWISCIKEPPVSQLLETRLEFSFTLAPWKEIIPLSGIPAEIPLNGIDSARLLPGDYRIILQSKQR